ncbi:MAG TPA: hypothetical protein VHU44_13695 [Acidobacteriaceae bacterium]|jgi:hypothetical protein|nr:hypothetical protein [Acidobacteriaceae bacterium]
MNDFATNLQPTAIDSNRCRRPDAVPSRVAYHHPLTEFEKLQAELVQEQQPAPKRRFSLPSETGGTIAFAPEPQTHGRRIPHPGDLVYWVACLGGGCLLLLCATH